MKRMLVALSLLVTVALLATDPPTTFHLNPPGQLTSVNTGLTPKTGWYAAPMFSTTNLPAAQTGDRTIVWNTTLGKFVQWNGTVWAPFALISDLSGFLTAEADTLATVTARGDTTANNLYSSNSTGWILGAKNGVGTDFGGYLQIQGGMSGTSGPDQFGGNLYLLGGPGNPSATKAYGGSVWIKGGRGFGPSSTSGSVWIDAGIQDPYGVVGTIQLASVNSKTVNVFGGNDGGDPQIQFIHKDDLGNIICTGNVSADTFFGNLTGTASGNLTAEVDPRLPAPSTSGNLLTSNGAIWTSAAAPSTPTLAAVTTAGATTTNAVTVGDCTSGAAGADGKLTLYSEQGATDYSVSLNPNAAMASAANFYLPADEPAATYLLNCTTGGVIGYDTSTYLTAEADTLGSVTGRGATTTNAIGVKDVTLPTTANSSTGVIYKGTDRWLHNWHSTGGEDSNIFLGILAGNITGTGTAINRNVGIGYGSLNRFTTGYSNVGGGYFSLFGLNTGWENTAWGDSSLNAVTSGSYNAGYGTAAGHGVTTKSHTTAIGHASFYTGNVEGGVALGNEAGYYETADNKLFIDNTTRASEADGRAKSLVYGIFAAAPADQYLTVNGNLVATEAVTAGAIATQDVVKLLPATSATRFTGSLTPTDLTADRTYTLPNATGTVPLLESANTWTAAQIVNVSGSRFGATSGTSLFYLGNSATARENVLIKQDNSFGEGRLQFKTGDDTYYANIYGGKLIGTSLISSVDIYGGADYCYYNSGAAGSPWIFGSANNLTWASVTNAMGATPDVFLSRKGAGNLRLGAASNGETGKLTLGHAVQSLHYNPDDPRPDGWPRTAANAADNEFEGESLGGYSWHTYSAPSGLSQTTLPGWLYLDNGGTVQGRDFFTKAISWAGDFDVAVSTTINEGGSVGIAVLDDAGAGVSMTNLPQSYYSYIHWGYGASWGAQPANTANHYFYGPIGPMYFRLKRVGSTVTAYWSHNGVLWGKGGDMTWSGTATKLGIHFLAATGPTDVPPAAAVDWLRVAAP